MPSEYRQQTFNFVTLLKIPSSVCHFAISAGLPPLSSECLLFLALPPYIFFLPLGCVVAIPFRNLLPLRQRQGELVGFVCWVIGEAGQGSGRWLPREQHDCGRLVRGSGRSLRRDASTYRLIGCSSPDI